MALKGLVMIRVIKTCMAYTLQFAISEVSIIARPGIERVAIWKY